MWGVSAFWCLCEFRLFGCIGLHLTIPQGVMAGSTVTSGWLLLEQSI